MRVHFFVRTLNERQGGGSHHNAIFFIRALRERGHEVVVHAFEQRNNEPPADISLTAHSGSGLRVPAGRDYLADILQECQKDADVFFLYGVDFAWGAGAYRRRGGTTPVVVYLDTYLYSLGLMRDDAFSWWQHTVYRLKRLAWDTLRGLKDARAVDVFCAVSPFVKDAHVRLGFPKGKILVVPNFFDIISAPTREHAERVRLLYVGRFTYDKGVDLLLSVLARLSDEQWTLHLVGDGPQRARLEEMTEQLGLKERVAFVPWVNAQTLADEYAQADVFVHPARWPEPFGRTIVEALMRGVPVVVPEKGGASWIADGAGITFRNGDEHALYDAIRRILSDASLRSALEEKAPMQVARFRKEHIVPELESALQSAVHSKLR